MNPVSKQLCVFLLLTAALAVSTARDEWINLATTDLGEIGRSQATVGRFFLLGRSQASQKQEDSSS